MNLQQIQQHAGGLGFSATGSTAFLGLVSKALPLLQALSFLTSIVVGVLTAIWYIRKLRRGG